ncbi:50S ribosomal protein L1 [Limihaloglobus sulfuriphilus]|uniref:Large ribosomal subunit protein uL1 n=1 Tax=Limihaloglobus sulfuriphilus TaxID=1851148 RepID=A0A1Q2MG98_9BACT|nr:50S ribosomal protein L1 [Limihaloglobus sulfuriphilus]AQQ71337.1 50S ribosomal protein L1 [Limihaloglobus sulfuriphilus]
MAKNSKRFKKAIELASDEALSVSDAVKKLKSFPATKFDQSVDIAMQLGIDPRQADQLIRGAISLPNGIGKAKNVIAFCDDSEVEAAKAAGAVEAGTEELVKKIEGGWMDFDVAIASPKVMGQVGKLGRVLGPQGKMPSPKNGTVTPDVINAVKEFAAGKVEFRNDSGGNVHTVVGKLSFDEEKLIGNIKFFIDHITKMRPASCKGVYLKKITLSATMSPGVNVAV